MSNDVTLTAKRATQNRIDIYRGPYVVANVYQYPSGWKVIPTTVARQRSRKYWASAEEAARSFYNAKIAKIVAEAEAAQ